MDADAVLAELTDLSAQIEAAVVLDEAGAVLGSTASGPRGAALARAAGDVLTAAEAIRPGRVVSRVELQLERGGFFVVVDGNRRIAATTVPRPTAGLVVYDLRACLRRLSEPSPVVHA
jgi:hypothetical protein